ncbi:MAG: phosphoethanolamine--lipid A transferase [Pedobacter sp.]|nr:phosphoethanolamine--lipid A transferase [Pedobacter sp.]
MSELRLDVPRWTLADSLVKERAPETVILLYAALLSVFYNTAFWRYLGSITDLQSGRGLVLIFSVFILLTGFFSFFIGLLPFRWCARVFLSVLLPVSALASYFMNQYGIPIDGRMIQNVFETNTAEAVDLFTWKLLVYLLVLGVAPVAILWRLPIRFESSWWLRLRRRALFILLALVALFVVIGGQYQYMASVARNNKEIRYFIVPNNVIKGLVDYGKEVGGFKSLEKSGKPAVMAADARRGSSWVGRSRKSLFVLVLGETARAANFGLNGYERNTTPELTTEKELINLSQMRSCGTDTAVSLPCMMSGLGRSDYSLSKARGRENLLDAVQRAGLRVVWIDNQSGCKRVCDRVENIMTSSRNDSRFCEDGECHDGILVDELHKLSAGLDQDTLLVLHQMGSHGPAYFKRYPADFARFQPDCRSAQLDKCSRDEIQNAYDNTILYTDHVLSGLIDVLRGASGHLDTGLFYLSDHGESLGELGLYLHGAPYVFAPDVQTHVPSVLWLSEGLQKARGVSASCMAGKSGTALSQDNLFDSILGIMDVQTKIYRPALDMFHGCTKPA